MVGKNRNHRHNCLSHVPFRILVQLLVRCLPRVTSLSAASLGGSFPMFTPWPVEVSRQT